VLLADEPTDGLDPHHQLQVMELLRDLAAEGRGVLTVLHDLSLAERFCDRLLLLHEGQIIAAGPAETVLTPENCALAYRIETVRLEKNGRQITVPWRRLP
jgi:iron complex transport system ATP-binding protein